MRLSAGLSLRAQLALVAGAGSLLAAVLAAAILVPTVGRVSREHAAAQGRDLADLLAGRIASSCLTAPDRRACEGREVASLADGRVVASARIVEVEPADSASYAQLDGGPPARWLVIDRTEAGGERTAAVLRLGIALALVNALLVFVFLYAALVRSVGKPADRLLSATERVGSDTPLVAEEGPVLGRLGVAFDRMSARLAEERRRVEEQVDALKAANRQLADAKEQALRQEKLATVGRLAAGVAHEIGNPLAALLGYVEILRHKREAEPLRAYVEPMEREARRIDRILRDLLDFARPGRRAPVARVASVPAAVEKTVRLLRPQARFRAIEVRLEVPDDLPPVTADEHGLGQVLVNLLLNAADAMKGQGTVHVHAEAADGRVVVNVRDTGPGIAPEHLPHLFDPFYTTKEPGEGTGLGLAICHAAVESFGGTIAAGNAAEGGAVFRIELPAAVETLAPAPGAATIPGR